MCHGQQLPTNSMIEAHALEQKLYLKPGIGFRSTREFHNKLASLQMDGEWQMRELMRTENAADWVPMSTERATKVRIMIFSSSEVSRN